MFSKSVNRLLRPLSNSVRGMATTIDTSKIGIIGVPFSKGQRRSGVHLGPQAIRDGNLIQEIQDFNQNVDIKDYGDVPEVDVELNNAVPKNMHNYRTVMGTMRNLSQRVTEIMNDKRFCITLGGDHTVGIGSVDGHLNVNPNLALFWVDAHMDINTNETSNSGSMHGMPVALLAKELRNYWANLPGIEWAKPRLSVSNIVYIGLRAVDPLERVIAKQFNMHCYGMREVDKYGLPKIMEMAMNDVDPQGNRGYHISFDIDSLDRNEAPSTGIPLPGGLTTREGIYIIEELHNTSRLEAMDLVEVNPAIGSLTDVKKTVDAAVHLLKAACGTKRIGHEPLDVKEIPLFDAGQ